AGVAFGRVLVVVGVVGGRVMGIGMVVVKLDDRIFCDRFGIGQGRAEGDRVQRIVVVLAEVLGRIEQDEAVERVVVGVAVVDVDGPVDVEGEGPVWFCEFMPEGDIGAVDVEAVVGAVGIADRGADGGAVLVGGRGDRGRVGAAGLKSDIG